MKCVIDESIPGQYWVVVDPSITPVRHIVGRFDTRSDAKNAVERNRLRSYFVINPGRAKWTVTETRVSDQSPNQVIKHECSGAGEAHQVRRKLIDRGLFEVRLTDG